MLPSKKLKPYYDKVVWLYCCRTFKPATEKDREALRTHDRFGISSWPQQFVFDPRDDSVLTNMPRRLPAFMASLDRVLKGWKPLGVERLADGKKLHQALQQARAMHREGETKQAIAAAARLARGRDELEGFLEARELLRAWRREQPAELGLRLADPDPRERAIALEDARRSAESPVDLVARVEARLIDESELIMVRIRALRYLAESVPSRVIKHGAALLAVNNDPLRYEVLSVIGKHPDPQIEPALLSLFVGAGGARYPSRNPNVVRIRVAQCLEAGGGVASIDVLAKPARKCNPNNGLTRIVLRALTEIGGRVDGVGRKRIVAVLKESLPPVDTGIPAQDPRRAKLVLRRYLSLVELVLQSISRVGGHQGLPPVPSSWTAADRAALKQQLARL